MHELKASVVIPAHNEEENLPKTVSELQEAFGGHGIPYEIILVNDNSADNTAEVMAKLAEADPGIKCVERTPPPGFGRAIRSGLEAVEGDVVIIYMADCSDDPKDAIVYYEKIEQGYDCVFGSRFRKGSQVENYPKVKLIANRIVNRFVQLMFFTRFNDLTNAFKAYRAEVIRECGPYHASHFNITIEMSLSALIRRYVIAEVPIRWYGRTWGSSNLKIGEMGRRYLAILLKAFAEKLLISDDLVAERLSHTANDASRRPALESRVKTLEERLAALERGRDGEGGAGEEKS